MKKSVFLVTLLVLGLFLVAFAGWEVAGMPTPSSRHLPQPSGVASVKGCPNLGAILDGSMQNHKLWILPADCQLDGADSDYNGHVEKFTRFVSEATFSHQSGSAVQLKTIFVTDEGWWVRLPTSLIANSLLEYEIGQSYHVDCDADVMWKWQKVYTEEGVKLITEGEIQCR